MESTVRALDRGIDFLEVLATEEEPISVADLVVRLKLPKSTVLRIAHTLELRGLIARNPLTGAYRLGVRVLHFSKSYLTTMDYRRLSLPIMRELRDHTKETVSLYVEQKGNRVCVERAEGLEPLRSSIQVGEMLPLVSGAAGKVLLAFLHIKRQEVAVSVLEDIRTKGYAVSHAEYQNGVSSVAAPILNLHGDVIAALSVSGPSVRYQGEHLDLVIKDTFKAAAKISRDLGHES